MIVEDPADAGHVAWDMESFKFLDEDREFDSIHPSLLRQSRLNNNYGLYKVTDDIYQVRGLDISDLTLVRGRTGWIIFDVMLARETARAAWKLFQEHVGEGLPVTAVIYSHSHVDHWGGIRGIVDDRGENLLEALPSTPVQLLGITSLPSPGDKLYVVNDKKKAKEVVNSIAEGAATFLGTAGTNKCTVESR